ncbi:hypothetical protein UlMin_025363 [Ulmus minor]
MAEIVGSAFFGVLFERQAPQDVLNFLRPKKAINKRLRELRVLLWSADEFLDDAEEMLIYNPRVEKWHNELKDVVYKASESADKIESEALRRKLEGHQSARNLAKMFTKLCSNPPISSDNYVEDELVEILSSLEHLVSQKDELGPEPAGKSNYSGLKTRVSERFRPTPVADESGFCGREDIKETIVQSLRSENVCDDKIAVVPITGTGEIGKTTLAQIIYNHAGVKLQFGELTVWVTVSTDFDLPVVSKRIIGHEQVVLFKRNDALKGNKFLLVLDDVWSEDRDG